ncbi:MAG: DUF6079 family protein [Anaerolineae bacterium]
MTTVGDLIQFEEVTDVIQLRKAGDEEEIVSKYVISDALQEHLLYMFQQMTSDTHRSFNVIGNYGTGKSHFLKFVAVILEHPELRPLIRDPQVRHAALDFPRHFAVVKFECPAAKEVPLRRIFYDEVQEQVEERYDIEVEEVDLARDYDNKENVRRIVSQIKAGDPTLGLVVIVDEISDFLKQKDRADMTYDINFLRELGEVSQDSDFLYVGAMQEHVFTNPKYVEQAANIARSAERWVDITITKEDIGRVLSQRVVAKTANQRTELETLLEGHQQYFTNLTAEMETYLDLFPIHPYVISVFEDLPYFEQRGIINFASDNVKAILGEEAPTFITYDRVYDQIDQIHEIRNLPEVAQVIRVVGSLATKVDLLKADVRAQSRKIVKALAVLKMLGGTEMRGATAQELANTLFIMPPALGLFDADLARDNIERIIANLIKAANGQFITVHDGTYYLDVEKTVDFDVLIEKKIEALDDTDFAQRFRHLMEGELELNEAARLVKGVSVYDDTATWRSRKSFRSGYLIIGEEKDAPPLPARDFTLILHSPFADHSPRQTVQNQVIVGAALSDDLMHRLQRIEAATQLARAGEHRKTFDDIAKREAGDFKDDYLAWLIQEGYVVHGGVKRTIKEVPAGRYGTLQDLLDHLKSHFLEDYFSEQYPQYPAMKRLLSTRNINSEMHQAILSLDKGTLFGLDQSAQSYLESLGVWKDGRFDARGSAIAGRVMETVAANDKEGKLTAVDDVVADLAARPVGLQPELVYLLLAALLYNGEVVFVRQGGQRLYASDFSEFFKRGMAALEEVRYLEGERELPVARLVALFEALGLQPGLVRDKASRAEAVKALHGKALALKDDLDMVRRGMIECLTDPIPDIPWSQIQAEQVLLAPFHEQVERFEKVTKVTDLGRLELTDDTPAQMREGLARLESLKGFVMDYLDEIRPELKDVGLVAEGYEPLDQLGGGEGVAELRRIEADCRAITTDFHLLMKPDQRRPLKGKFIQYRDRYKKVYYALHEGIVGSKVPWADLEALTAQPSYRSLNGLKSLPFFSSVEFDTLALKAQELRGYRCREFNVDDLDSYPVCPRCSFPRNHEKLAHRGVAGQIQALGEAVSALWGKWERQLFDELAKLGDKLPLLSAAERRLIEELMAANHLPDQVSPELLRALSNLAADLQVVELSLDEFRAVLLAESSVLTVAEFDQAVERFKARLLKGTEAELVRIKVV